ncbi:MAG TPA: peptide ABC transporter substrate-binding protein [Thermomicrobiales bacterium]|nr:peptide ABC transporter substrate-binding protein [Thermomicrobiales bacterium]
MTAGPLHHLFERFTSGEIDRRGFVRGAAALGVSASVTRFLMDTAAAQNATPASTPSLVYDAGTEGQERGAGGELRIIQWQAPTSLSPHVVGGSKDYLGSLPVMEPLMHLGVEAELIPNLITEVPSLDNGGLSDDMTSVTFHLLPDVTWSDGEPFTAEDVRFTIEWVQDSDNGAVSSGVFEPIAGSEVLDELTIRVDFDGPNPFWSDAFAGTSTGFVYPKHILEVGGDAHDTFMSNPIGTGPYVVESFTPNDQVVYVVNENYREPNKPYFSRIVLKGGGDAAAAARSVLQTGDYDYAWNLQVEPEVLLGMVDEGDGPGEILEFPGVAAEKLNINFSDPNTEVDGERSHKDTPHPILTDIKVREAIAKGIDRQTIADEFYGFGQQPSANILNGAPEIESPNTVWEFDLEAAAQALEDGGWVLDGDVRKKDGMELSLTYATSVNSVRQKTQALVKSNLESIGFRIALEQVDAGVFFDSAEGNEQNAVHFYWDLSEQQNLPNSPRPIDYMELWYAGPDGSNIAQKSNAWSGGNWVRYQNEDYDAAFEAARTETDPERLAELFIEMNDILIMDHALVPLVVRGTPGAISKRLRRENVAPAPFSYDYWNIANWNLAEE